MRKSINRVQDLLNSNHGRKYGWFIELNDEIIGELKNPKYVDMFWEAYEIIPLNDKKETFVNSYFTWNNPKLKFKNKTMNEYALYAYPSMLLNPQNSMNGVVNMRGLYLLPKGIFESFLFRLLSIFHK
ncbi:hypothetical protein [Aureispira sp. CCB-E]|uniref:hypothetical protein n=1 Tax=Aureispira sp. CCB-E TaxID=3051121 RepID=UPI0028685019|nr:hypothetical protein [Aureispira sp. CCB-E]WMX17274.1 hypothetical protein QP953_12915 [Aureispira sp. CCB-E]